MAGFWIFILAVLVIAIGYAAYADHAARRDGQILVPVKEGRGRRTKFVRMDRDELEQQKLQAIIAKQAAERAERKQDKPIATPATALRNALKGRRR